MIRKKMVITLIILAFALSITSGVNSAPTLVNNSPTNGASAIDFNPTLTAWVNSTNATIVYFLYNNSGSWSTIGSTSGVNFSNEKITQSTTWSEYSKSYTYTINISDENGSNWANSSAITFTLVTPTQRTPIVVYAVIPVVIMFLLLNVIIKFVGKIKL